jgi:hypothetical protein
MPVSKIQRLETILWEVRQDIDASQAVLRRFYSEFPKTVIADINIQAYQIYFLDRQHGYDDKTAYRNAMQHRRELRQYYKYGKGQKLFKPTRLQQSTRKQARKGFKRLFQY